RLAEQGVKFLAVGGDALLLRSAMLARLAEAKDAAS
ncbi:MAG: 2-keto-3-deoxy-L-rhamnonate aldolase RhmA, partial [Dinoroseobacter sp.]